MGWFNDNIPGVSAVRDVVSPVWDPIKTYGPTVAAAYLAYQTGGASVGWGAAAGGATYSAKMQGRMAKEQANAASQQAAIQRQQFEVQRRRAEMENIRSMRSAVRAARARTASIINISAFTGVSGSSGAAGAVGGVKTQLSGELNYFSRANELQEQGTALASQYADVSARSAEATTKYTTHAAYAGALGSLGDPAFTMYTQSRTQPPAPIESRT